MVGDLFEIPIRDTIADLLGFARKPRVGQGKDIRTLVWRFRRIEDRPLVEPLPTVMSAFTSSSDGLCSLRHHTTNEIYE